MCHLGILIISGYPLHNPSCFILQALCLVKHPRCLQIGSLFLSWNLSIWQVDCITVHMSLSSLLHVYPLNIRSHLWSFLKSYPRVHHAEISPCGELSIQFLSSFLHIILFISSFLHYQKIVTPEVILPRFLHVTSCPYSQHVSLFTLSNST